MYVVKRSHHNPILVPDKNHNWESYATFNMSVVKKGKTYYGVYRAISAVDTVYKPEQVSTIGIGTSKDGTHFEDRVPFITPVEEWEKYGCEDPRVTFFEGNYYTFYTALSNYPFNAEGIKVAVAISKDLKKVKERHLVTPFNAKAMTLFPERVGGKVTAILSVHTDLPPSKVAIVQADEVEDFWDPKFWEEWLASLDEHVLDLKRFSFDHIEVGATPIKTAQGWLLVYSYIQNYFPSPENKDRIFGIEAVMLNKKNPLAIVGHTAGPMLVPAEAYELFGYVGNVIFPSGAILEKQKLTIYYGAADTTVCMAHVNINDLISSMRPETQSEYSFKRSSSNPILTLDRSHPWESKAVFNPAAIRLGLGKNQKTYIVYRGLSEDNTSSIGLALSSDGIKIDERLPQPIYIPTEDFESKKISGGNSGCEDPRLTKIGANIYMCYTAFDGIGPPRVAITSISEKDFLSRNWKWAKPIVITPEGFDDKDTCIFPEKINGEYFILHRVGNEMCGDYFKTLDFKIEVVKKCIRIIGPRINSWDSSKVGISAPPLKTKYGWLLFYHGVSKSHSTYRIGVVLLDLKDPAIILARSSDPIFEPRELYEKVGIINNVVFPCGIVEKNGTLYMYYGGADTVVGVATMKLDIVVKAMTRDIKNKSKK